MTICYQTAISYWRAIISYRRAIISYWRARISNGFTRISNRVHCDSINSNNTSHASACIQLKHKNMQFNEAYSNSYTTQLLIWLGFEYLWGHCSFSHGKGRKKLHPIGRTTQTDYCRSTVLQLSKFVRRWPILPHERTRSRRKDISSS